MISPRKTSKPVPRFEVVNTDPKGDEPGSLIAMLRSHLFEPIPKGGCKAKLLIEALVTDAINGNLKALQEILDRIDGAPKKSAETAGAAPEILEINATTARRILEAYDDEPGGQ